MNKFKWQPIETAPKDGTPLLGYSKSYDGVFVIALNGPSWWTPGLRHLSFDNPLTPTHWMPIPEPPE